MSLKKLFFTILATICALFASAQTLSIEITGIENPKGTLRVGIFNSKENWFKTPFKGGNVTITSTHIVLPIQLPAGQYAISLYQDENDNGTLDTGDFGKPIEKYGFSNNPRVILGNPSFKKCMFDFESDKVIQIQLK